MTKDFDILLDAVCNMAEKNHMTVLMILTDCWENMPKTAKYKVQRKMLLDRIYEISPGYFQGYFKKEKP